MLLSLRNYFLGTHSPIYQFLIQKKHWHKAAIVFAFRVGMTRVWINICWVSWSSSFSTLLMLRLYCWYSRFFRNRLLTWRNRIFPDSHYSIHWLACWSRAIFWSLGVLLLVCLSNCISTASNQMAIWKWGCSMKWSLLSRSIIAWLFVLNSMIAADV